MSDVAAILNNLITIRERDGWDPVTDRPWREKAVKVPWQNK
jgi:hypothetical protein